MESSRDDAIGAVERVLDDIFGNYLRPQSPPDRELNVTMGQMHCLGTIAQLGKPTMSELAKALHLHPSTVTVLVDGLVAHGLAARRADPVDRRVVRVAETAKGRKNHERHMAAMHARLMEILGDLSEEQLASIRDGLGAFRDAARRHFEATQAQGESTAQGKAKAHPKKELSK